MRLLALLLVTAFGAASPVVPSAPAAPDPPALIAIDCSAPAIHDASVRLLDDLRTALLSGVDWHRAIAEVGRAEKARTGASAWPAVKCAMHELNSQASLKLAFRSRMRDADVEVAVLQRARSAQWLTEHRSP